MQTQFKSTVLYTVDQVCNSSLPGRHIQSEYAISKITLIVKTQIKFFIGRVPIWKILHHLKANICSSLVVTVMLQ